jgi:hypothetical protein
VALPASKLELKVADQCLYCIPQQKVGLLLCATSLVKLCYEKSFYLQDLTAFETTVCAVVVNFETTAQLVYCSFRI